MHVGRLARSEARAERVEVGVDDVVVRGECEDECDVDVDTRRQRAPDRRHPLRRCRDLDHEVGAVDPLPVFQGKIDAACGAVGGVGRHLEADEAVRAIGALVDRPQDVGGAADIADGKLEEDIVGIVHPRREQLADLNVVGLALGDGLLEDGGVAGHAGDVVLGDHPAQLPGGQQLPADEIEPDRLTLFGKLLERVRRGHQRTPAVAPARTAPTMASASMPAAAMSSAGVPDPGSCRTARWVTRGRSSSPASASRTAAARPPSG